MNNETTSNASPMEAFFTRQRANEGIKLPLSTPDGKPTTHYIKIRGVDSDAFKTAEAAAKRTAFELVTGEDQTKLEEQILTGKLTLLAALVIEWSFDIPCTPETIIAFLREAPQIANEIDTLASRRRLFFAKGLTNSSPTPAANLS